MTTQSPPENTGDTADRDADGADTSEDTRDTSEKASDSSSDQRASEKSDNENKSSDDDESEKSGENKSGDDDIPEPSDEQVEKAKEHARDMQERYQPDARRTVVMPDSDGTVSGTAFVDTVDEDDEDAVKNQPPQEVIDHDTLAEVDEDKIGQGTTSGEKNVNEPDEKYQPDDKKKDDESSSEDEDKDKDDD